MKHANVALFVPHNGCPHQCSFCNQRTITGHTAQPVPQDVLRAVRVAKASLGERTKHAEIAFFGGSFTALDRGYMVSLLEAAFPFVKDGTFSGIRISTRPDAIDEEVLLLLRRYGVTVIELGAQSMDDRVLAMNERGHTAEQVGKASSLIKQYNFTLGLQMMTGLYGDTAEGAVRTARKIANLRPENVRIYPTLILRGTELGRKYTAGEFQTLSLEETVSLCASLLDFFESRHINVIRLGLHGSPELEQNLLSGPWHPAFRQLCESRRMLERMKARLQGGHVPHGDAAVLVNPKNISTAIGQKKENIRLLEQIGYRVRILPDASVPEGGFTIYGLKE